MLHDEEIFDLQSGGSFSGGGAAGT